LYVDKGKSVMSRSASPKKTRRADPRLNEKWRRGSATKTALGHRICDMLLKYIDVCGKTVLDIGCGDGGISVAFAERGAIIIGLDNDANRIRLANNKAKEHAVDAKFILVNAEAIGLPDALFDVIICNAVIEHVFNPDKLISEISRLLKPGGFLFLDTPSRYSILQLISDTHYGLFGISIMPRWIAAVYVVKIRKRFYKYDVDNLRTYKYLNGICRANKIMLLEDANVGFLVKQIMGDFALPTTGLRSKVISIFKTMNLECILVQIVQSSLWSRFVASGWSLIGRKIL